MDKPEQRQNALELSGFLAEALVLSGKVEDGVVLAKKTFKLYDEGDGALLKERDYYTWAVWKSGCITKTWNAILKKKVLPEEDTQVGLFIMLGEAYAVLFPAQDVKGNFQIRRDEIDNIRRKVLESKVLTTQ
jgi:hypothetical protein